MRVHLGPTLQRTEWLPRPHAGGGRGAARARGALLAGQAVTAGPGAAPAAL